MFELPYFSSFFVWAGEPIAWLMFFTGLIFGSFYNVCIWRIPEGTFWKTARSGCRNCSTPIPWYLNIPLLSWISLRGKSACCKTSISPQYPLVEFITAMAAVLLYIKFPFVSTWQGDIRISPGELIQFIHAFVFFSILLISSVIDIRHLIIPDGLSLGLVATAPLVVYFLPHYTWPDALIGVLLGGGILYLVAWIYWITRKIAGMGMGDVKLLAGIGGWLGWQSVFPTILYSSVLGSLVGLFLMLVRRKKDLRFEIPFGPFLAAGALIHMFFGSQLLDLLLNHQS